MIKITDEDIEKVEKKFDNIKFDDESKAFIKCMESKDIQACPGAGKTTSLVAKLDILANNMPFDDNSGILVLTHTNVAVDEIKKKLGANAKIVLGYPNHVGTFQSFVNKFLAIPMYIKLFGKKPVRIDSEIFNVKLLEKLKFYYLDKFILDRSKNNKFTSIENFLNCLEVEETKVVLRQTNGRKKTIVNKLKPSYRNIKRALDEKIILQVINDGYLTYSHCYDLALKYITEYPNLSNIFQKRFRYIFVDEAQDTSNNQFEIIKKLFENSDVIIQKIGDNNQAIFNISSKNESGWNIKEDNCIEIKNTKRLSKPISEQASKVAFKPQELLGNGLITIQPTIILFDDARIADIIPRYAELIIEHNLHSEENYIFKAIGGVGKVHDAKHTIRDYYSNYSKEDNSSLLFDNLIEKLKEFENENIEAKEYRSIILDIVKEYLKKENIKNEESYFTKVSIFKYLKENDEEKYNDFKLILFQMTKKLHVKNCIKDDLQNLITIILNLYEKTLNLTTLNSVVKNYKIDFKKVSKNNVYKYVNGDIDFDIEIKTIHKSKGETHTATLVLETFKSVYDIFTLMKLLQNKKIHTYPDKKKLLYVAMSRATHFLCLAVHKKHTNIKGTKQYEVTDTDIKSLENNGFRIIELNKNISTKSETT